jgi:PAS domain S-box-containing protein
MQAAIVLVTRTAGHELGALLSAKEIVARTTTSETLLAVLESSPVVVVVDVAALGNDGYDLVAALGENDEARHIAVLALVAPERESIELALRHGADDILTTDQPSHPATLARVDRHLRQGAVAPRLETSGQRAPSERPLEGGLMRQAAERRLKRFQPYVDFFKNSADGMVVIEPTGKILFANPRARSIFPLKNPTEQANVIEFIAGTDREYAREIARGFLQGSFPKNVDFRVETGGHTAIINVNFSATLRGESAVLFTFRDVTKEREIEQELTKAREFLERVIDSSLDAIVATDRQGNVRLFNRAAGQIFGYEPAQVVGVMNAERLYPSGVARQVMRRIRDESLGGFGRLEGYVVDMLDASGNRLPVRISAGLIYEKGEPWGTVGVFRDVREERRMATRLAEAEAQVRDHEKGVAVAQLAGATAHELNQPLTVMLAYSDMLRLKVGPDSPLCDTVAVISQQAERMAEIVRQIGRITRYETKSYVGSTQILDLEKSSRPEPKG